jgi:DNA gyrase subunit A
VTNTGRGFKIDAIHVNERESKLDAVLPSKLARGERVLAVVPLELEEGKTGGIAIGTKKGVVKITSPQWPVRSDEFTVINLDKDDEILNAAWVSDVAEYDLVFIASDSSFLTFPAEKVRPQGLSGSGMAGIGLKTNHAVSFSVVEKANRKEYVVVETTGKSMKATPFTEDLYPSKGRATGGYSTFSFIKGESEIVAATVSKKGVLFTDQGQVAKLPALVKKRVASGTKLENEGLF